MFISALNTGKTEAMSSISTKEIALEGGIASFTCDFRQSPIWTKIGKTTNDVKNLAIGEKNLPQFKEQR